MPADNATTRGSYAYVRVHDEIRSLIKAGKYPPGALLPSVREITTKWGVSNTTARRVLHELVLGGYATVESRRGHVCTGGPDYDLSTSAHTMSSRFAVRSMQVIPADVAVFVTGGHVSTVNVRREAPPAEVALALRVDAGEPVIVRRRVFADEDDVPMLYRTSYLPTYVAEGTPLAGMDILDTPWPMAISIHSNCRLDASATQTTARHPTDSEAAALDLRADSAVLVRDDVSHDPEDTPLDFTRNIWPGDTTRLTGRYPIPPA